MNSFEEGFMAGFLMKYRKEPTEKEEEKWQYPSDWLPLPEVGENEAAFLIFSIKDDTKHHSLDIGAASAEDRIAGITNNDYIDYIDMGNGTTYSGTTANGKCNVGAGITYTVGKGTPLTDNVEMYILRIHFTRPNIFHRISPSFDTNNGVYIIAYNIDCGVIAGTYINSNSVEVSYNNGIFSSSGTGSTTYNKYLMYAKFSGDSKNFGDRLNFFNQCFSLQRVDFETPPTCFKDSTFNSCYSLSDVNLPDLSKVTTLGTCVFDNCHKIKKLVLPSVTTIPSSCFTSMDYLEEIVFENVTTINSMNFKNGFYNLSKITLPKVQSIYYDCFNKAKITKIDLSDCESIGNSLFCNLPYLEELDLKNITSIGNYNFQNCYNLKKINAPNLTTIGLSNFCVTNISELYLPSVTSIGTTSFNKNYKLTTVNLPSLKTLGDCFQDCYNLTNINFPLLESSGNSFQNCYSLRSIDLPSLTTLSTSDSIGAGCYALQNVTAPNIDLTLDTVFPDSYMIK